MLQITSSWMEIVLLLQQSDREGVKYQVPQKGPEYPSQYAISMLLFSANVVTIPQSSIASIPWTVFSSLHKLVVNYEVFLSHSSLAFFGKALNRG